MKQIYYNTAGIILYYIIYIIFFKIKKESKIKGKIKQT